MALFTEVGKNILKFMWNHKGLSQNSVKKDRLEGLTLPLFKIYYKTTFRSHLKCPYNNKIKIIVKNNDRNTVEK